MRSWRMMLCCTIATGFISGVASDRQFDRRVFAQEIFRETDSVAFEDTDLTADDDLALQPTPPKKPSVEPATPPKPAPRTNVPPAPMPKTAPPPTQPLNTQPLANPPQNPFANAPANQPMNQPFLARMSRTPDMFGDSFTSLSAQYLNGNNLEGPTDLPLAGRFKNEHNSALPTDRVFFYYHHFHNAISVANVAGQTVANDSVDRFTVGIEKTFADGDMSLEFRMPFLATIGLAANGVQFKSGNVGDLVINLKSLLYQDDDQALAFGVATTVPTGDNLAVTLPDGPLSIKNQAVFLVPYLAYQTTPAEDWFVHAWLQTDFAAAPYVVSGFGATATVRDQTLLYADIVLGYWLWHRDNEESWFTGAAALLELHYTTALTRADRESLDSAIFGTTPNHIDVLNMTVGSHVELTPAAALRAGFTFPLRSSAANRFFDSEFTTAIIFRY